jgi:hypothetical protein
VEGFQLWLRGCLELLRELVLAGGVIGAAQGAIGLAEEAVSDVVGGVHGGGALEIKDSVGGVLAFEEDFAEEYVGAGGVGFEEDGAL